MTTNFNVTPYYDDFSEDKNFHRVLFRPGYAVQARELTQLQTILQNQVTRMGNHLFKDGAQIIPGEITYTSSYEYVKLSVHSTTNASDLVGIVFTGDSSGVVAEVVNSTEASSTQAATIFVVYKKQGTDNATKRFTDGESLTGDGSETATVGVSATTLPIDTNATGVGTAVNVQAGIYYVNGFFVNNDEQTLILDSYSTASSYRVGFTVTESFITPSDDTSLNDNATGTSNVNAPGAHRYKIALTLAKKELSSTDDNNFIDLLKVKDGLTQSKVIKTDYNVLEDTLARRTYDESGDYVVQNFDIDIREHYFASGDSKYGRGIYRGVDNSGVTYYEDIFTVDESKARLAIALSKGKAYVRGYEIDTQGTNYVTIDKSRDFDEINNSTTTAEIGNYVKVTNIFGSPDIGFVSGESNAFKKIDLYKSATASRGTANIGSGVNQNLIGTANGKFFEYDSGTVGASSSNTTSVYKLGLFNIASFTHVATSGAITVNAGEILTGATSGATGIVEERSDTNGLFILSNVKGTFQTGELVDDESGSGTYTVSTVTSYDLSNTKQVASFTTTDDDSTTARFTADTVLTSDSTDPYDESQTTLTGTISVANSSTTVYGKLTQFNSELIVGDVIAFTDDTGETLTATVSAITSDTQLTISSAVGAADVTTSSPFERRRAKLYNSDDSCLVFKLPVDTVKTLKTNTNDSLTDTTLTVRRQFVKTLNSDGIATFDADANETFDAYADGDFALSIISTGAGGSGADGDIIDLDGNNHESATIFTRTGSPTGKQLQIDLGANYNGHKVKLYATITRSVANEKTKTLKQNQINSISSQVECQAQRVSLGRADVYKINSVYMSADFSTDATTSDVNITDRYDFDNGQRDNFYDIGSLVLRPGQTTPTGRLRIDFDYFEHGQGDYFSVDSYTGAIEYEDIPSYASPSKGTLQLRDCIDFRPRVGNFSPPGVNGAYTTLSAYFDNSQTNGPTAGAVPVDLIKPGTNFRCDLEYYLSRIDAIYIDRYGLFKQSRGAPAIDPQRPEKIDDAMLLYYLRLPAYTFNTTDVAITPIDNRRFTMRDIGKIQKRVENLEYYTQLSLLEQTALNTQVQDSNGLDRFKNGFVVDTFKGHNVGKTTSRDYLCAMDMNEGVVRPMCSTDQVKLIEVNTTDSQRSADGYQKTGDLITLSYTEEVLVENTNATKTVTVNPFLVANYIGDIKLTPDADEWKDTKQRPDLIIQNNVLYNAIKDIPNPGLVTGTFWNEWQTNWTGTFKEEASSTITEGKTGTQTRTGIKKTLGTDTIKQSFGEKVVDVAFASYIRAKTVSFTATGMKPNTRVYPFFEEVDVSSYCTPDGGSLGGNLVTDANGKVEGTFAIPDPNVSGNPKWRIGERRFRLTSESDNFESNNEVDTFATATYTARGLQVTQEETIYSTRVPVIKQTDLFESTTIKKVTNQTRLGNSNSSSNDRGGGSGNSGPSLVYRNNTLVSKKITKNGYSCTINNNNGLSRASIRAWTSR